MKTFRKSSLISSVALLLVAIVAMSGATFAWFSLDNTASAGTIEMTATSASSLYISDDTNLASTAPAADAKWGSKITWTDDAKNMPAVSGTAEGTGTFFKTSTDDPTGKWDTTKLADFPINAATANTDFIAKKIWVKSDSAEAELSITPTLGGDNKGYERIAILDPDGNVTVFDNAGESVDALIDQNGNTTPVAATQITATSSASYEGDLTTAKAFFVFCWFEGQDTQCYNANSGGNMTIDLAFSL